MTSGQPGLSVIVPAYRSATQLRACLAGIVASDLPRGQFELIVVDDCSDDDTPTVAHTVADSVLTTVNGPRGPAEARNVGAMAARGSVLVFVDSDVVVAATTLSGFARCFEEHPEYSAAFGAYDDAPADPGFVSQYRNLLHRYVHMLHPGEATSFWAGCGAIRLSVFLAVGGFDTKRYPRPQIEDIELGYRLVARGYRILTAPELNGKHLKRWTLGSMLRTDLRERAVPWMHLIIEHRSVSGHGPLNLAWTEKLYTILTAVALASLTLAFWARGWLWLAVGAIAIIIAGNAKLISWFGRQRGKWFALGIIPLRLLFYVVGGVGAAWALATHRFQPARVPPPALRASTDSAVVH